MKHYRQKYSHIQVRVHVIALYCVWLFSEGYEYRILRCSHSDICYTLWRPSFTNTHMCVTQANHRVHMVPDAQHPRHFIDRNSGDWGPSGTSPVSRIDVIDFGSLQQSAWFTWM